MRIIGFIFGLCSVAASCQDYGKLELIADLPSKLHEVSGIERLPNQESIWAINDSRNPPEVYRYNLETNKTEQTIRLKGYTNIDWEDLTMDAQGTLYVGDFGNNFSNREDLTIYHLKNPEQIDKRRYEPEVTRFQFEDQKKFPPKSKKDRIYDVESFIVLGDHFYLFTRHRDAAFDGETRVYQVPLTIGDVTAKLIGTFSTCNDEKDCQITSAAVHVPTGKIALLSHNKVWIFSDYEGNSFLEGSVEKIKLHHNSQKESICFKNENELYIADERSKGKGGNVYLLKL